MKKACICFRMECGKVIANNLKVNAFKFKLISQHDSKVNAREVEQVNKTILTFEIVLMLYIYFKYMLLYIFLLCFSFVFTSIHREGFISLGLEFQGTDQ